MTGKSRREREEEGKDVLLFFFSFSANVASHLYLFFSYARTWNRLNACLGGRIDPLLHRFFSARAKKIRCIQCDTAAAWQLNLLLYHVVWEPFYFHITTMLTVS